MMQPMVSPKSAPDVLKTGKEESDIQVRSFITLSLSQRTSFKLFQTESLQTTISILMKIALIDQGIPWARSPV